MRLVLCPNCQSACPDGDTNCWMCGAPVVAGQAKRYGHTTFSLTSAFLIMTLISVACGITVAAPGLGIVLAIIVTPALIRTMILVGKRRERGQRPTAGDKVSYFLGYAAVAVVAGIAGMVAFVGCCFVACFGLLAIEKRGFDASGLGAVFIWTSIVLAGLMGVLVFIYLNTSVGYRE